MEATAAARKAEPLPVARVEDRTIPGPAGAMPVRLYWPNAARQPCRRSPITTAAGT